MLNYLHRVKTIQKEKVSVSRIILSFSFWQLFMILLGFFSVNEVAFDNATVKEGDRYKT